MHAFRGASHESSVFRLFGGLSDVDTLGVVRVGGSTERTVRLCRDVSAALDREGVRFADPEGRSCAAASALRGFGWLGAADRVATRSTDDG